MVYNTPQGQVSGEMSPELPPSPTLVIIQVSPALLWFAFPSEWGENREPSVLQVSAGGVGGEGELGLGGFGGFDSQGAGC